MKIKLLVGIITTFLVILSGCANQKEQPIKLTGESNNWIGEIIITKQGNRYEKKTIIKLKQPLKLTQLNYSSLTNNIELGESKVSINEKTELQSTVYGENSLSGGDINSDWATLEQKTMSGKIIIEWVEEGKNQAKEEVMLQKNTE